MINENGILNELQSILGNTCSFRLNPESNIGKNKEDLDNFFQNTFGQQVVPISQEKIDEILKNLNFQKATKSQPLKQKVKSDIKIKMISTGTNTSEIILAVPGFTANELSITDSNQDNVIEVIGTSDEDVEHKFIDSFKKSFQLMKNQEVKSTVLKNGLLIIKLETIINENEKRRYSIIEE